MRRPSALKWMAQDEWNALSEERQREMCESHGIQTSLETRQALSAPNTPLAAAPLKQKPSLPATKPNQQIVTVSKGAGIRSWTDPVTTKDGKIIMGSRIRECVLYQVDVKKDPWYSMNLSKGFILNKADKLDADTPDDANLYVGDSPLLGIQKIRDDDYDILISKILRNPKNDEERQLIRNKFGVTSATISFLAKKDCSKCKGLGLYSISSYPDDPMRERLTETVECGCSHE